MARLIERYPSAECALEYHGEPWRLLVMGRLSAQCTDARVNIVCEELFARFPTLTDLADAPLADIESIVRPCGLYKTKGRDIKEASAMILSKYGGRVPDTMEELLTLPGIGRKTANLVLSDYYGKPAVVTDTHCIRIAGRLGLTKETDPYKVEMDLVKIIEPAEQAPTCHRFVHFGRDICRARNPRCTECPLSDLCSVNSDKTK